MAARWGFYNKGVALSSPYHDTITGSRPKTNMAVVYLLTSGQITQSQAAAPLLKEPQDPKLEITVFAYGMRDEVVRQSSNGPKRFKPNDLIPWGRFGLQKVRASLAYESYLGIYGDKDRSQVVLSKFRQKATPDVLVIDHWTASDRGWQAQLQGKNNSSPVIRSGDAKGELPKIANACPKAAVDQRLSQLLGTDASALAALPADKFNVASLGPEELGAELAPQLAATQVSESTAL